MEARYNITRWTVMPRGGHCAALEQPALPSTTSARFFATCDKERVR
jgi:hypothetical protein